MARGKNRDPKTIREELQVRLDKLKAKEAMEDAKNSPHLAPMVEALEALREERTVLKRKDSGPNSWDNRLMKKQLWIDQILAERALCHGRVDSLTDRIETLSGHIEALAVDLSNGETVDQDSISGALEAANQQPDLLDLEYNEEAARYAREVFGKKDTDDGETEYEEAEASE